jgi:hypothetical protein
METSKKIYDPEADGLIPRYFFLLHLTFYKDVRREVLDKLNECWRLFSEYIHWTVHTLDPQFHGINEMEISEEELLNAEYFIDKFTSDAKEQATIRNDLIKFMGKEDIFSQIR